MTDSRNVEGRISLWFEKEEAVSHFPDRLLKATFEQTRELRQARTLRWRSFPMFRSMTSLAAAGAAAVVLVVAGALGFNFFVNQQGIGAASPSPSPAAASPEPTASPLPASAGGMWPQSTLEEVRQAQERAEAGDPDYTWQLEPQLFINDSWTGGEPGQIDIVDRFLREVLGWEAYVLNPYEGMARNGTYDVNYDQRYLRCEPGRANPLYPGEGCAPTLDDLRYESVSIDLAQPDRLAVDGIWVVNRWRLTQPFAQADPVAADARATERLEEFLAARIAGTGAEGLVTVDGDTAVPLLYSTSTGAPYERYEIERVEAPEWPYGYMMFSVRLFADGDATVVEQEIRLRQGGYLWLDANSTTENGQPVTVSHTSGDGEVTVSAPSTWEGWMPGKGAGEGGEEQAPDVWFGALWHDEDLFGQGERIEFTDPVAYDAWCAAHGGTALLSAPATAAEIAQLVIADSDFETTEPVTTTIGGLEAVSMDVALRAGGEACRVGRIEISRWIHTIAWGTGWRLRLYLVDLPAGMSVETLAITVVASEERFGDVIEETAPIIESIQFHAP